MKSQDRMAKDSVVIFDEQRDNKLFFPSKEMMTELMGIPKQFNLNVVGQSLMSEIIGQSVEYPMYDI